MNRNMILPILLIGFVLAGCSPKSISKENDTLESIEVTKNDPKEVEKILASDTDYTGENYTNIDYVEEKSQTFDFNNSLETLKKYSWYNDSVILTFNNDGTITSSIIQGRRNNIKTDTYGTYSIHDNILQIQIAGFENRPTIISNYSFEISSITSNVISFKDTSKNPEITLNLTCVSKL